MFSDRYKPDYAFNSKYVYIYMYIYMCVCLYVFPYMDTVL